MISSGRWMSATRCWCAPVTPPSMCKMWNVRDELQPGAGGATLGGGAFRMAHVGRHGLADLSAREGPAGRVAKAKRKRRGAGAAASGHGMGKSRRGTPQSSRPTRSIGKWCGAQRPSELSLSGRLPASTNETAPMRKRARYRVSVFEMISAARGKVVSKPMTVSTDSRGLSLGIGETFASKRANPAPNMPRVAPTRIRSGRVSVVMFIPRFASRGAIGCLPGAPMGRLRGLGRFQEGQHVRAPLGRFIFFAMHAGDEDMLADGEDHHLGRAGIAVIRFRALSER